MIVYMDCLSEGMVISTDDSGFFSHWGKSRMWSSLSRLLGRLESLPHVSLLP